MLGFAIFDMARIQEPLHSTLQTDYTKIGITWTPPNNAPTISSGPAENPASTSSSPTNVGSPVTFYATGTDPDSDQYYLAICKAAGITAGNNATPTCTSGAWCYSAPVNSGTQSTCATTTLAAWSESNAWFGYVCDKNASGLCSAASQGTGDSGSPFNVNHAPYDFYSASDYPDPLNPGATLTIDVNTSDADPDGDNLKMYICTTQAATASGCSVSEWCNVADCTTACSCQYVVAIPSEGQKNYYVYVFDQHNLGASNNGLLGAFTVNNVVPTISNITINGGAAIDVSTGGEGTAGNKNVDITADITDNNGCADVSSVTAKAYPSGLGAAGCTAQDNNNCYFNISCAGGACSGNITKTYTCTANFKYHADPTDAGSPRATQTWKTTITASDEGAAQNGEISAGASVALNSFPALDVTAAINYGSLATGEIASTTALAQSATVSATGNTGLDVNLSGTNMTSGGNSILVSRQRYATSAVQYQNGIALTSNATQFEINLKKTTTTATLSSTTTFWGLQIPTGLPAGEYSGTNTFGAVTGESAEW